ncbi:MAG: hypothetical protein PX481_25950 [Microcystis sp. M53603_WE2]|nr:MULTISPECIES: hypothetical protein [unclassified Microcystis]MCZ8362114.1 hypothetical protein [Microcystis sp. LE19-251.1A]MDJ0528205.1 hypothetical protein [Microcystis sp. M53600_WE12]MDJ0546985.1 hypothetical protein [Microcystis sp. M53601_WE4]MDJ0565902.1 hypothetical protein [Microcystis sp. M49629_WE12]MCZ8026976.1 hypothetical protein [Microcystis sp. LE19-10.1B]
MPKKFKSGGKSFPFRDSQNRSTPPHPTPHTPHPTPHTPAV